MDGDLMDRDTILKVAKVARLELNEGEMERYAKDLEDILDSFSVLDEAPMNETYTFNPIPVVNVLREDEPGQDIDDELLRKQLETYESYVRGPRLS
ncbi:MAG: Asp-tRNA(Asn)/Glu-tRNA(Gln) amidotransferase subunit GatC [Methanomassiliicoccales archaeon]|nr:Asp-tRNA(Asn)/Glu-tRNA(Gln) amidotransferase subunit GatC [Methanomassiliicoccales archaeon]